MPEGDERFINRCITLAQRGMGKVAPNPIVGAVLVYQDEIISEGWHKQLGEAHAERMAILDLGNDPRIPHSTLYVNLEPCSHFGKTPPCANLIAESGIKKVVFGSHDPNEKVNGKGLQYLNENGIEIIGPVLENKCDYLNRRFITFHKKKRPYIVLKWAETVDGFLAPENKLRTQISGEAAQILLHKWRSEESAILVGAETAKIDKPLLNVRKWDGNNPIPIFFDPQLRTDYSNYSNAIVFNKLKTSTEFNREFVLCNNDNFIEESMAVLYHKNIQSVLVEGGRTTLDAFILAGIWDEIRVIKSKTITFNNGIKAPLFYGNSHSNLDLIEDTIKIFNKR